jgi:hypothetical protein
MVWAKGMMTGEFALRMLSLRLLSWSSRTRAWNADSSDRQI